MGRIVCVIALLCSCFLAIPARAQQQPEPEDPEDEKQDRALAGSGNLHSTFNKQISGSRIPSSGSTRAHPTCSSISFKAASPFDCGRGSRLIPIYRYQRFPGNPKINYENRLQLNLTLSTARGQWRYNLRTLIEGRFPDDRAASARFRFRPGVDYTLPLRTTWRPTIVVSNEFFIVPWYNPFANGGSSYTQNRFQVGVRLPVTNSFSVRPYYMLQSVNLPPGWDTNEIVGISLAYKVPRKTK